MPEMPLPREHHRHPTFIRGGDDFRVADGTSGLDDGANSGVGEEVEAVAEGEEGVGGGEGAGGGQDRFHDRDFGGVDAAHLAGADSDRLRFIRQDDGVGFDVGADDPG